LWAELRSQWHKIMPRLATKHRSLAAQLAIPQRQARKRPFRIEPLVITGHGTTECT